MITFLIGISLQNLDRTTREQNGMQIVPNGRERLWNVDGSVLETLIFSFAVYLVLLFVFLFLLHRCAVSVRVLHTRMSVPALLRTMTPIVPRPLSKNYSPCLAMRRVAKGAGATEMEQVDASSQRFSLTWQSMGNAIG